MPEKNGYPSTDPSSHPQSTIQWQRLDVLRFQVSWQVSFHLCQVWLLIFLSLFNSLLWDLFFPSYSHSFFKDLILVTNVLLQNSPHSFASLVKPWLMEAFLCPHHVVFWIRFTLWCSFSPKNIYPMGDRGEETCHNVCCLEHGQGFSCKDT